MNINKLKQILKTSPIQKTIHGKMMPSKAINASIEHLMPTKPANIQGKILTAADIDEFIKDGITYEEIYNNGYRFISPDAIEVIYKKAGAELQKFLEKHPDNTKVKLFLEALKKVKVGTKNAEIYDPKSLGFLKDIICGAKKK